MSYLSSEESCLATDAFFSALYGLELLERWRSVKWSLEFSTEAEFMFWVLSCVEREAGLAVEQEEEISTVTRNSKRRITTDDTDTADNEAPMGNRDESGERSSNNDDGDMEHEDYDDKDDGDGGGGDNNDDEQYEGGDGDWLQGSEARSLVKNGRKRVSKTGGNAEIETKWFKCELCETEFSSGRMRNNHIRAEHPDTDFPCRVCGHKFKAHSTLEEHIKQQHGNKEKLLCQHCPYQTYNLADIRRHCVRRHGYTSQYQCHECYKEKPLPGEVRYPPALAAPSVDPVEPATTTTAITTSVAPQQPDTPQASSSSMALMGQDAGDSDGDGREIETSQALDAWLAGKNRRKGKKIGNQGNYRCELCGRVFVGRRARISHIRLEHAGVTNFPCRHCDKTFQNHQNLHEHVIFAHEQSVVFPCEQKGCSFKGRRQSDLLRHSVRRHGLESPFFCAGCSRYHPSQRELEQHKPCKSRKDESAINMSSTGQRGHGEAGGAGIEGVLMGVGLDASAAVAVGREGMLGVGALANTMGILYGNII